MPGCRKPIEVVVPTKYSAKMVKTVCGSTGYYGYPEFCTKCDEKYAERDWKKEALDVGECWDEEDY